MLLPASRGLFSFEHTIQLGLSCANACSSTVCLQQCSSSCNNVCQNSCSSSGCTTPAPIVLVQVRGRDMVTVTKHPSKFHSRVNVSNRVRTLVSLAAPSPSPSRSACLSVSRLVNPLYFHFSTRNDLDFSANKPNRSLSPALQEVQAVLVALATPPAEDSVVAQSNWIFLYSLGVLINYFLFKWD